MDTYDYILESLDQGIDYPTCEVRNISKHTDTPTAIDDETDKEAFDTEFRSKVNNEYWTVNG
jgi:hypothetical protein